MKLRLIRDSESDQGTYGRLLLEFVHIAHTIELPWRNNLPNISRIPAGTYQCHWRQSPRFGLTLWIRNVPGRSWILIHTGNLAGDTAKGFKTHSAGCVIVGTRRGTLNKQRAVLASRTAMRRIRRTLGDRNWTIEVVDP